MTADQGPRRMFRTGALACALAAVAAVAVVDLAVAEVRPVGSESMKPALRPGERMVVAKVGHDRWALPRGTVVVFDAADLWARSDDPEGTVFVKRIVGLGGERVTCCTAQGALLINGEPLDEPYLDGVRSDQFAFDVEVQAGHYWLMGDNRAHSSDARMHLGDPGGGNVPASRIIGTVEGVIWPPAAVRRTEGTR